MLRILLISICYLSFALATDESPIPLGHGGLRGEDDRMFETRPNYQSSKSSFRPFEQIWARQLRTPSYQDMMSRSLRSYDDMFSRALRSEIPYDEMMSRSLRSNNNYEMMSRSLRSKAFADMMSRTLRSRTFNDMMSRTLRSGYDDMLSRSLRSVPSYSDMMSRSLRSKGEQSNEDNSDRNEMSVDA